MITKNRIALVLLLAALGLFLKGAFGRSQIFQFEFNNQPPQDKPLARMIEKTLDDKTGSFGVVVEALNSKRYYSLNPHLSFPSASLYKLFLMAAIFQDVQDGKLKLDDQLAATKAYLDNQLGGADNGYPDYPEPIQFSVEEGLDRVARISDNYAAVMLTDALKDKSKLAQIAKKLGTKETHFETEIITTTPFDIYTFFKKLYQKEVVSKDASEKIIELLSRSQLNDRIPAKLPAGVKVAHKTGEFPYLRHDAGIIYLDQDPYIVVLMSKDLQYEDEGVEALAQLSKDIFDYLNK